MRLPDERKPLLRWAGSKKRQARQYAAYFPREYGAYVEPFAGSASFYFAMNLQRAKLNDINVDLMNFYRCTKLRPREIWDGCNEIERSSSAYYDAREKYNNCQDSFDKAVLFYYINRNCFNGIYRVNRLGRFNVPFSAERVSPYLTWPQFAASAELLHDARLCSLDFEAFCHDAVDADDFVFLDPPYAVGGSTHFHHYNRESFSTSDLERLSKLLDDLHERGAKFLISFPEDLALERPHLRKTTLQIRRTIAGQAAFRGMASEVLVFNYDV